MTGSGSRRWRGATQGRGRRAVPPRVTRGRSFRLRQPRRRAMIEEILPPAAPAADTLPDAQGAVLFRGEEAAIGRAVARPRREFTTARAGARDALARLGVPAAPIVPGERGAPQWPPGVVGSMTHCRGYRAAAVARRRDLVTIGLDAEPDDALDRKR